MEEETMKMRKLLPFIATTAIATSVFGFAASADDFNITVNHFKIIIMFTVNLILCEFPVF